MKIRRWITVEKFEGAPKLTDFEMVEEEMSDELKEGEILCKAEWLSVDPFVRAGGVEGQGVDAINKLTQKININSDGIPGSQIARVMKSRHPDYPVGTVVNAFFGWRDWTVFAPEGKTGWTTIYRLPLDEFKGLPESYALGALGSAGLSAYFGVEKILEIKEGGTLVVSTAAGAVGSMVLQMGKLKGCKCLVFTGSEEKVNWLKKVGAGFIFNYKRVDLEKTFKEYAPEGIDYYFENVGGDSTYYVMRNMKDHGRIAVCGATSYYNEDKDKKQMVPFDYLSVINKKIRIEGFSVYDYQNEWRDALKQIRDWIIMGKITVEESVTEGFENMPQAFVDLFEGKNIGKQIVKA